MRRSSRMSTFVMLGIQSAARAGSPTRAQTRSMGAARCIVLRSAGMSISVGADVTRVASTKIDARRAPDSSVRANEPSKSGGTGAAHDERALVAATLAGDGEAFRRLAEPHRAALRAYCY